MSGGIMGGGAQGLSLAQEYVASKGVKPAGSVTESVETVTEPAETVPEQMKVAPESEKIVPKSEEITSESEKIALKQEKTVPENVAPEENPERMERQIELERNLESD